MTLIKTPKEAEDRVLLENVRWSTYEALLEDLGPHPGKRVTYDRGRLEIMTTSPLHERIKRLVGRFLELMTLEMGIEICSVGSTTWKRKDLQRGFEPDECYYIGNEEAVWRKEKIDLPDNPPPDLVVEIDISYSSMDRQAIYAAFGIPEAWRFDGEKIHFYRLRKEGSYEETEKSPTFPFLSASDLNRFLSLRKARKETRLMQEFSGWVKENLRKPGSPG